MGVIRGGNCPWCPALGAIIGAIFGSAEPANAPGPDDKSISQSPARTITNMTVGAVGGMAAGALIETCAGACRAALHKDKPETDEQGSIVPQDTQVASPYPEDRTVGGKGEGRRDTDPEAGVFESGSWELTQENLELMEQGKALIGSDGNPVVLHHRDQKREGPLDEMTATSHRAVDHPKSPSEIDRPIFKGERARHWRERARTLLGQ